MKRIFFSLTVGLTMLAFAACSSNNAGNNVAEKNEAVKPAENTDNTNSVPVTMLPGKLNFVNLNDGEQPVLKNLSITGNRCGSGEFNSKPAATEGIRCVFELNEYLDFYPETDAEYGIRVWVIKHKDNQSFYLKNKMSDLTPGFVQYCDIRKDPDAEEGSSWASFYVNPEDAEPGYYDFVFTFEGKVFATMLTKFFGEGELEGLSDDELANMIAK